MILVVDLEATCDEGVSFPTDQMEIIEIGAVWANDCGIVIEEFQTFVRPILCTQLTSFCQQLTSIKQADVDSAKNFIFAAAALTDFSHRFQDKGTVWGSWGQYDHKQLIRDSERHGISNPLSCFEHVNLKRQFAKNRKMKEVGMAKALQLVKLPLEGAHHRGIDDARNIARLIPWCLSDGKR